MKPFARIAIALCSAMLATSAFACSCGIATGDLEHDVPVFFNASSAVVVAEVREASSSTNINEEGIGLQEQSVKWEVEVSFKGPHRPGHIVSTKTDTTCCNCGMSVKVGKVYLLYLQDEQPYSLSECNLSNELKYLVPHIPILYRLQATEGAASGT
jgi:hypothetical protein